MITHDQYNYGKTDILLCASLHHDWLSAERGNHSVHERVGLDEVQRLVGYARGII